MPIRTVTASMRDPRTPASVIINAEARAPKDDPTLGIAVALPAAAAPPKHRLVTIGDSLTHGFQSGAIYNTDLSWPMIVAWEMGWDEQFRHPQYPGYGGLPLNIEYLVRHLEDRFGEKINWWEVPLAPFEVRNHMARVEEFWERPLPPARRGPINHNLAVYGWDVRDILSRDADFCRGAIRPPTNNVFSQVVENANERAAIRVLDTARDPATNNALPPIQAAEALGDDGGIETLVVMVGANNALGTVVQLKVKWSEAPDYQDLVLKSSFTVWAPDHFQAELAMAVAAVKKIKARHVIWGTVPHVTIAPIARGVGKDKVEPGSRYFPWYTRPWIDDASFDERDDPRITENEARAIDSAIDQYNEAIVAAVAQARQAGLDWYVLELAGLLDRLASRRYLQDPAARPGWWTPYPLPDALAALRPRPDSRFFASGPEGRTEGGLFSLDGVHPTTIGYGIVAQEIIRIMESAGVPFRLRNGTARREPINVDFNRLIAADSLISAPPRSLTSDLRLIGWFDEKLDFVRRMSRVGVL